MVCCLMRARPAMVAALDERAELASAGASVAATSPAVMLVQGLQATTQREKSSSAVGGFDNPLPAGLNLRKSSRNPPCSR